VQGSKRTLTSLWRGLTYFVRRYARNHYYR